MSGICGKPDSSMISCDIPIDEKDSENIWHIKVEVDKDNYTRQICPFHKFPTIVLLGDYACMSCQHYIGRNNRMKMLFCGYPASEFKREFATDEEMRHREEFLVENRIIKSE